MRSLLKTLSLLVFLLPSLTEALKGVSTLKGVRGHKRLDSAKRILKEDKKCKKYAEPKALKATPEPKATVAPKESVSDDKASKDKAAKDKADKDKASKGEEELECLEYEDREDGDGSTVIGDPSMGSTGNSELDSVNVDCEAIANDSGPKDTHMVSFSVNIDVIKELEAKQSDIYAAMEEELQQKVAPRIAGCSSRRMLAEEESSKIVHVDFGEIDFDQTGCDSSLAKEAGEMDGVCMSSDVPVDVYFVGDFPDSAIAKVEVAIEEHQWDVDGLLKTSEVDVVQTGSSMAAEEEGGVPVAAIAGGVAGAVVLCVVGFCCYMRSRDDGTVAKAELDTDAESSDDEKQKIPEVQARAVNGTN